MVPGKSAVQATHKKPGWFDLVEVNGTSVPVIFVIIRLTAPGLDLFYTAWVNELAINDAGILESLATQPVLPTLFIDVDGKNLAVSETPNLLRELSHKSLRIVSELAAKQVWTPLHFAFARAATEHEWPTARALWDKVRFFRVTELITLLLEAKEERQLLRMRQQLGKLDLLILDELGYVPASKAGAELLFDVIATAYERNSLIVTTNLPFENWTEILGSERLTGAALDRLTHRCHILETKGESYRLQDAKRRRRPTA